MSSFCCPSPAAGSPSTPRWSSPTPLPTAVVLLARAPAAGLPAGAARLVLGVGWRRRRQRPHSFGTPVNGGGAGVGSSGGSLPASLPPLLLLLPTLKVGSLPLSPGVGVTAPPPWLRLTAAADAAFGRAATVVVIPAAAARGWRAAAQGLGGGGTDNPAAVASALLRELRLAPPASVVLTALRMASPATSEADPQRAPLSPGSRRNGRAGSCRLPPAASAATG